MKHCAISVQDIDGRWAQLGAGTLRGVWPENIELTADTWGSKTCTFDLHRDPDVPWPDISAIAPVEVTVGGVLVWSGRIREAPTRSSEQVISVQCDGWQAHLDDRQYERVYVHTDLGAWQDARSFLDAQLGTGAGKLPASGQINTDRGLTLMFPRTTDGTGDAQYEQVAAVLDLGPASTAKRVVLTVQNSNTHGEYKFYVRGANSVPSLQANTGEQVVSTQIGLNSGNLATVSGTFTTARRYVMVLLEPNANVAYGDADNWFRITSAQVFADTAYEFGDSSILRGDQVVSDALDRATSLLASDRTRIDQTSGFTVPEFAPDGPRTARQAIEAANAFFDNLAKVDEHQRMVYRVRPTVPDVRIGQWGASSFDDSSSATADDIYNEAIVAGRDAAGQPIRETRTSTGTVVERRGFTRTHTLDSGFKLTTTSAQRLGDKFLDAHRLTPFKGRGQAVGHGSLRDYTTGQAVGPERLLLSAGGLMHFDDRIDPDTGAVGRDGRIVLVSYRPEADAATFDIDSSRGDFDTLLAKAGVLVGQLR